MNRPLLEKIRYQLDTFIDEGYWPNAHVLLDEIEVELSKPKLVPVGYINKDNFEYIGYLSSYQYNWLKERQDFAMVTIHKSEPTDVPPVPYIKLYIDSQS